MASTEFHVIFEGRDLETGEIDVADLAPALMALANVVTAANEAINGNRAEARLKFKSSQTGSFDALLSLDVSMTSQLLGLLEIAIANPEKMAAANELLDILLKAGTVIGVTFSGAGLAGGGLLWLLKMMKGAKPDKISSNGNGTTNITINTMTIIADDRALDLMKDVNTRKAVEDFGKRALNARSVEQVKITTDRPDESLTFSRDDARAFAMPELVERELPPETTERTAYLKIITSQFRDGYVWRFTDGGEKPFTAKMLDRDFIDKVEEGRIALSANDTLRCLIEETQAGTVNGLTKEIAIKKVIDYIPGAKQLKLM